MAVAAVAVLAEQRTRPGRVPWYPWVLTALAAGSSIALNFGHPYIPLDPPPGAHWEGAPMRVRLRVLVPGTSVRLRRPGRGERGTWAVGDRLVGSGTDDPAYELRHQPSGRTRVLRRSRLRLTHTATSSRR